MLPRGETSTCYIPEHSDDPSVDRWLRTNAVLASLFTAAFMAVLVSGAWRGGQKMVVAEGAVGDTAPAVDRSSFVIAEIEPWTEAGRSDDDAPLMRP